MSSVYLAHQEHAETIVDDDDDNDNDEIIDDWGLGGYHTLNNQTTTNNVVGKHFHLFAQHELHTIIIPITLLSSATAADIAAEEGLSTQQQYQLNSIDSRRSIATNSISLGDSDDNHNHNKNNPPSTSNTCSSIRNIPIHFPLYCIEKLTPIDMINMSNGIHDSTGHCVWTGSFFFIRAIAHSISSLSLSSSSSTTTTTSTNESSSSSSSSFFPLCDECFFPCQTQRINEKFDIHSDNNNNNIKKRRRNIIELGCGTGIATIALLKIQQQIELYQQQQQELCEGSTTTTASPTTTMSSTNEIASSTTTTCTNNKNCVVMTDADPDALQLSHRNYQLNFPHTNDDRDQHNNNRILMASNGKDSSIDNSNMSSQLFHQYYSHNNTRSTMKNTSNDANVSYQNKEQQYVHIHTLEWGSSRGNTRICYTCTDQESFDTVYATDVLYDIGLLPLLLQTVHDCLSGSSSSTSCRDEVHDSSNKYLHTTTKKYFVLSHVPRACYNSTHPPPPPPPSTTTATATATSVDTTTATTITYSALEQIIISAASKYHLQLVHTIRPRDIMNDTNNANNIINHDDNNDNNKGLNGTMTLEEMDEIGAAVLIFGFRFSCPDKVNG